MMRPDSARLLSLATLAALAACSGGGGSASGEVKTGGDFLVLKTEPVNGATIYLNEPVNVDFSTAVDLDSASLSTVTFQAFDQQGEPVQELVTGSFALTTSAGDAAAGRQLQFVPKFATNNTYDDGGFRAGRSYLVQLVGGDGANTVLRDTRGKALAVPMTFQFTTRDGTTPAQLFKNPLAGGPARTGLTISTTTNLEDVPLGLFGTPPTEILLEFNQALNPNDTNVPVNVQTNPLLRDVTKRGRIYLEYLDPDPAYGTPTTAPYIWIPADVSIQRNDLTGATVALRPVGVLPNNATIRIIVEATLEDIAGESNAGNLAYDRVFGTFKTSRAYEQQWNGLVETFEELGNLDLGAAFPESQAEVGQGFLKAGFAFEGNSTSLEYEPTASEVVLNTAFTQVVPKSGLPFTVSGGVFNFKNVLIPQGVTVTGQGPNPMVWLCSGRFTVAGTLSVRGGAGARVDTLQSANYAKAGGVGVCGGGNGGEGTPSATQRDLRGGTGRGPLQEAGKGGRGGYLACANGCYTGSGYNSSGGGSGGGGGTMATQGDPNYRGASPTVIVPNTPPTANTSFQQKLGYGGTGCSGGSGSRTGTTILFGGEPGDRVFVDARNDNNFWGSGIRLDGRPVRIAGEIAIPMGGGGGGGGGDTSPSFNCTLTGNQPANDYSGGGGGGGGGVLIVKALEEITILASGKIIANGGHGGGGEQVGSCGEAGGGGGGAGGMVVLMSAKQIIIDAHGTSSTTPPRFLYGAAAGAVFQGNDYSFAISADGGVCTTGGFGSVNISDKYPASGSAPLAGTTYDGEPLGGLGGMGIVQLMVPPGDNLTDGTNTLLDDNITFRLPTTGGTITGAGKRQLLAWRGFPTTAGTFVDDAGVATNIGDNEGDIRPAPILLPVPFGARSRARSTWIDTGASRRRALANDDNQPRGIVLTGTAQVGPKYEFAGLNLTNTTPGYVDYIPLGQTGVRINYPVVVTPAAVTAAESGQSFLGQPAYRITLGTAALGEANRFAQYEAELLNASGAVLSGFRILSHTANQLLVDGTGDLLPPDATQVQVRAKFFKVVTNTAEGLGPVYVPAGGGVPIPIASVRFGFAFHQNPSLTNPLTGRFPSSSENDFLSNLEDPAFLAWLAANGPPRYVQWDVTFDMAYKPGSGQPPALNPSTPRPELHFLRLPFRF
ncbi:MAG: hypothetical protein WAT39_25870 [Planctomycetota bacterium]